MVLSTESVESLETRLNTQDSLWNMKIKQYYNKYTDEQMNNTYSEGAGMSGDLIENLINIEKELRDIGAELKTHINTAEQNISGASFHFEKISRGNSNSIKEAKEYIAKNKSSSTRQIDKLDEKSRAYLTTTFYSVSLITMSFFIYKQLKQ